MHEHGLEIDDGVAELAQVRHLLVELRHLHGERRERTVVDLVVHEDAQALVVPVGRSDRRGCLADRAVEAVLQ